MGVREMGLLDREREKETVEISNFDKNQQVMRRERSSEINSTTATTTGKEREPSLLSEMTDC